MNYSTGQQIKVGDEVVADGISGIVVCDFDNESFSMVMPTRASRPWRCLVVKRCPRA
jgi:hypothetical protein